MQKEAMKDMDGTEISIIMGVYNQKAFDQLEAAVRSMLRQRFTAFELLIYDDGSDRDVADKLEELSLQDRRIRLFHGKTNHGLAFGLNYCIRRARGKYIARMDADDISMPDRLEKQHCFLEDHPEYGFVGCNAGLLGENGVYGQRIMPETPGAKDFLAYSPYIHPSVMFRRAVFDKYGLYSEAEENRRCEDYELFMRLLQKKCTGFNIQEILFLYREDRQAYQKRKYRYRIDECRLRYTYFKKLGILSGKGCLYAIRPLIAGMIPGRLIYRIKKGKEKHGVSFSTQ